MAKGTILPIFGEGGLLDANSELNRLGYERLTKESREKMAAIFAGYMGLSEDQLKELREKAAKPVKKLTKEQTVNGLSALIMKKLSELEDK